MAVAPQLCASCATLRRSSVCSYSLQESVGSYSRRSSASPLTGWQSGGDQEPSCPLASGSDADAGGANGQVHQRSSAACRSRARQQVLVDEAETLHGRSVSNQSSELVISFTGRTHQLACFSTFSSASSFDSHHATEAVGGPPAVPPRRMVLRL